MRKVWPIAATLLVIALGCSDAARDRIVRFFFEVPDESSENGGSADTAKEPEAADQEPESLEIPESKFASVHPPYRIRDCKACHSVEQNMRVRDDLADACQACHARYFGDEVAHEPVTDGECALCHLPHRSEFSHLLTAAVPGVCTDCHDSDDLSEGTHAGEAAKQCMQCHDAHFGAEHLLRAGLKR